MQNNLNGAVCSEWKQGSSVQFMYTEHNFSLITQTIEDFISFYFEFVEQKPEDVL